VVAVQPAVGGQVAQTPVGGVETGDGSTGGPAGLAYSLMGAVLMLGGAAGAVLWRRRRS
jgi:hypothetical protein